LKGGKADIGGEMEPAVRGNQYVGWVAVLKYNLGQKKQLLPQAKGSYSSFDMKMSEQ
jgi:hypothetical protein